MHAWARVVSRPEPGLALLDAGKRDFPFDEGLPEPQLAADALGAPARPLAGQITAVNDQHAFLRCRPDTAAAVGHVVRLGLSHPCTAFDKWRVIPWSTGRDDPDPSSSTSSAPTSEAHRKLSDPSPTLGPVTSRGRGSPVSSPFTYLTVGKAGLYRQVMLAFVAAKRRFTVHLRPEDVREALGLHVDLDEVTAALVALEGLGQPAVGPRHQPGHHGRGLPPRALSLPAHPRGRGRRGGARGLRRGARPARGHCRPSRSTDIATQLRALFELAQDADPDPVKVHLALRALVDRFTDLAANAQAFMGSLQRTIDLHDADAEAFRAYKDRLIDYLERFVTDLVGHRRGDRRVWSAAIEAVRGRRAAGRCRPAGGVRRGTGRGPRATTTHGWPSSRGEPRCGGSGGPGSGGGSSAHAAAPEPGQAAAVAGPRGDPAAAARRGRAQRAPRRAVGPLRRLPRPGAVVRAGTRRGGDAPALAHRVRAARRPAT